jgi:hypothetical protein
MFSMSVSDFVLTLAVCVMVMGILSVITGVIILVTKVAGNDLRTIAAQTASLAKKGIAEDVAGLVGNASALIEALNQLVRSVAGVGVFLIVLGVAMLAASYALVIGLH